MPASPSGSAEAVPSSSAGGARTAAPNLTAAADEKLPVAGACWRGKYQITGELTAPAGTRLWRGTAIADGATVVLRAFHPVEPEVRALAWSKLAGIDSPHLQRAREACDAEGWRVEVADDVSGQPLHEWRAGRAAIDLATAKSIVGQLAEALAALHPFELVHLGLRPDVVFVTEGAGAPQCVIAGLENLTSFDRKQPVPVAADPLYAPPEALGLKVHVAGPGLCAWDWWSLGRVAQELVLGKHIVGLLANAPTRPAAPAVVARAEALVQESDPKGPRAGGVEAMPALDPQLQLLLRGLLTSAKDQRWTGDNVDRWVRGQAVKEHYDTPRVETHFRWHGQPCTVPEVAAHLQSAEHWAENESQLFQTTTPGTLAHFLKWSVAQAQAHEQLNTALELADSLPLKLSSPAAQREAITIVALLQLSAGKLLWRGRTFDSATVAAMMTALGEADALMVLRALSTRSTALQIERIDAAGGRALTELGRTVGDVEGLLKRYGWLAANDVEGAARLHRLALEPIPALRALRDGLAEKFAGSDHPAMEKLFKAQNVGRGELVALAWVSSAPERCKFYTHSEAARRRAEALRARGVELIQALTWVQLERALQVGRTVFAGWGWFFLTWFMAGVAAAVLWPGPLGLACAAVPIVLALLVRMAFAPSEQRVVRTFAPEAKWTWRDGPARCRRELRIAGRNQTAQALEEELATVRKELGTLGHVQPSPVPLPELPRFRVIRTVGIASWVLVLGCVAGGVWRGLTHPPTAKEIKTAWAPAEAAKPKPEVVKVKAEEKPEELKISWPYKPGDDAVKLAIRSASEATPAQREYATKHGRDLVAPYRPESITTPIIMPVPGDENAVMIFDGKRAELMNQQVFILDFRPMARSWVDLGGRKGVFLDQ